LRFWQICEKRSRTRKTEISLQQVQRHSTSCAADCPQKHQYAGDKGGKSAINETVDDFVAHVMEVLRANCVDAYIFFFLL